MSLSQVRPASTAASSECNATQAKSRFSPHRRRSLRSASTATVPAASVLLLSLQLSASETAASFSSRASWKMSVSTNGTEQAYIVYESPTTANVGPVDADELADAAVCESCASIASAELSTRACSVVPSP
jgi:hypothetical protein